MVEEVMVEEVMEVNFKSCLQNIESVPNFDYIQTKLTIILGFVKH